MKVLNLSKEVKDVLMVLVVLVVVYALFVSVIAWICGSFDIGFAYVGAFVLASLVTCAIGSEVNS